MMKNLLFCWMTAAMAIVLAPGAEKNEKIMAADPLAEGWNCPPLQARARGYWWWLNANVTKAAITRDLEWMKTIGMGGGLVFDAGGATQGGHAQVPQGPVFGSPQWRELFKHTLMEANRLDLEIGLNIQSGWNLGGPLVTPEKAAKIITWSQLQVQGPNNLAVVLPQANRINGNFYKDSFVLAYRLKQAPANRPIKMLEHKSAFHELGMRASDCSGLLFDDPAASGEEDVLAKDIINLTGKLDKDGKLVWDVPVGSWMILRFGYTISGAVVSTCSPAWNGLALDYLDAGILRWYWHEVVDPIIADAGPLAGKAWKMIQTDSWELGGMNWSDKFPAEFKKRRGYDVWPWLPVIAGRIVENRDASNKFLADFRRTLADCIADNHYGTMAELAHQHGMGIQPESAGPHAAPLDGLKCYGRSDWPMSEFWVPSPHRPGDGDRFFVKQASSAAHIYGKPVVCAEGFTSIGPQWNEVLWNMHKPSFDHEACAGLNLVFCHTFTCSPKEMGIPGQEYFAGSHFNPQITWAKQAPAFVSYLNRCQFLLQQGKFAADVLYYYGNHVPNFVRLKQDDPAKVLPQYDYDVINEEVLLDKLSVKDGRLVIPGDSAMSYRVLVLPSIKVLSLEAVRKIRNLVQAGAMVVGPKPERTSGLQDDAEFKSLVNELWSPSEKNSACVMSDKTTKEILADIGVLPDVQGIPDWIHRRDGDTDIYFLSNQKAEPLKADCIFRVHDKEPELWDPVTGEIRIALAYYSTATNPSGTVVPLELGPFGSLFVVFRGPATKGKPLYISNYPEYKKTCDLSGSWTVQFDPKWGGPESVEFEELISWTLRPEEGIKWYSGTATYSKTFDLPQNAGTKLFLDLGLIMNIAEVRLNGKNLGVVWTPPFRVNISDAVKASGNKLEIDVVNTWYNRLLKDLSLPENQRLTKTNIRLKLGSKPVASGLLGPLQILEAK